MYLELARGNAPTSTEYRPGQTPSPPRTTAIHRSQVDALGKGHQHRAPRCGLGLDDPLRFISVPFLLLPQFLLFSQPVSTLFYLLCTREFCLKSLWPLHIRMHCRLALRYVAMPTNVYTADLLSGLYPIKSNLLLVTTKIKFK